MKKFFVMVVMGLVVSASGEEAPSDLHDFQDILKKYDEMPYAEKSTGKGLLPEMAFNHPFCLAVALRQAHEREEIVRAALKSNPTVQSYYDALEVVPRLPQLGSEPSLAKGEKDEYIRPVFFGGDTPIVSIKVSEQDGSISDGSGQMKDVAVGDYVLSTTAFLIKDPRYQKTCWARVHQVHNREVKAGSTLGSLLYSGEEDGKISKVTSTLDPLLSFYVKQANGVGEKVSCRKLRPPPRNTEFVSPRGDKAEASCWFAANDLSTVATSPVPAFNLDVELTGIYSIGEVGSQIFVHH